MKKIKNCQNVTPKWKNSDPTVREKSIEGIADQLVLTKIAIYDNAEWVSNSEVKKIVDESLLAKIASSDQSKDVRINALKKLTDQSVLAQISINDKSEYVHYFGGY
ncbi:MAG: hypothetical protein Q8S39_01865 [Ignavibacteria bacterium]|nr:hypothetical protein [Ignavibacteria bacterium]